ncbi:class I SAM-dependent methyltransferase [Phytoactinopolyspora alkaliphila]|uniref:Class I SAM-dependent methyltransferase n=1 Tax=Phytoactinopolyspora alkaliphila TaxID=1783498 RepID=A0A6N9YGJ0_9ACTN|nr:class I SAM-dependent methyltransferase [Phytoactinopolyspora alkaliphila]NED94082.1 class I SAM-dependent methyltransferase [Phytoactinopolyspora alkaliphila]
MFRTAFGVTRRQQAVSSLVALISLVAVVAAAFGAWRLAGTAATAVIGVAALVTLDVRRRSGELARHVKTAAMSSEALLTRQKYEFSSGVTNATIIDAVETSRKELMSAVELLSGQAPGGDSLGGTAHALVEQQRSQELLGKRLATLVKTQTREMEALLQLYSRVQPTEPMPPSGKWALNPQGLLNLYALVQRHRPKVVLELGSGTSTVWLGHALANNGEGRLVSVDHEREYAEQSAAMVGLHRDEIAPTEVRHAPLVDVTVTGQDFRWYDPHLLADVQGIDLLIVDGPPERTGPHARYPAVPVLREQLAVGALVILDDAGRHDEQQIIERWIQETPGLVREPVSFGRQAVLRYAPGSGH